MLSPIDVWIVTLSGTVTGLFLFACLMMVIIVGDYRDHQHRPNTSELWRWAWQRYDWRRIPLYGVVAAAAIGTICHVLAVYAVGFLEVFA